MITHWEYKNLNYSFPCNRKHLEFETIMEELKDLGQQGWEVLTFDQRDTTVGCRVFVFLKRPDPNQRAR